jgi:hypothetical protein
MSNEAEVWRTWSVRRPSLKWFSDTQAAAACGKLQLM